MSLSSNDVLIVNYHSGSVGDAFIAYAIPGTRYTIDPVLMRYDLSNVVDLKRLGWEEFTTVQRVIKKLDSTDLKVISTHRYDRFDFSDIPNAKVISIDPLGYEKNIAMRKILDLRTDPVDESTDNGVKISQMIAKIKAWRREEILDTDCVLSLRSLLELGNDYFNPWKVSQGLDRLEALPQAYFDHVRKVLKLDQDVL